MSHEAPLVLVDALHALLSANGTTRALEEEALVRIHAMKQHPNEAFVFGMPTLIDALTHWQRVTGGDEVTDALAEWLDTMDPKTTAGLDGRVLAEVQLLCPRLIPMAATPKAPADPRFASYVEALCVALAERARFANVTVWKSTVLRKLREVTETTGNRDVTALPHVLHAVAQSRAPFGQDNGVRPTEKLLSEAHFTPQAWAQLGSPNSFMDDFSVLQERTVVSDVSDPALEVSLYDSRLVDAGDFQIGELVSVVDLDLTNALRALNCPLDPGSVTSTHRRSSDKQHQPLPSVRRHASCTLGWASGAPASVFVNKLANS
jgi:hypothetical protein